MNTQSPPKDERFENFLSLTTHDLLAPLRKLGVLTDKFLENQDDRVQRFVQGKANDEDLAAIRKGFAKV